MTSCTEWRPGVAYRSPPDPTSGKQADQVSGKASHVCTGPDRDGQFLILIKVVLDLGYNIRYLSDSGSEEVGQVVERKSGKVHKVM